VRNSKSVRHLFAALAVGALVGGAVGCDDETDAAAESEAQPATPVAQGSVALRAPPPEPSPEERHERTVAGRPTTAAEDEPEGSAEEAAEPAPEGRRSNTHRRRTSAKRRNANAKPASGRARSQSAPGSHSPEPGAIVPLSVRRLVVSLGIVNREPTGIVEHVTLGRAERVFAFVELQNPAQLSSQVQVRFVSPSGRPIDVLLEVGDKPRWRTWAFTRKVRQTGTWTVKVRTTDGAELASTQFEVTQ